MLTPMDIHNKEFKTGFRGYSREDVDEFLDQVVNDFEKLYRENTQLKKDAELADKQLEQYKQLEKNLQETLIVAQQTASQLTDSAQARAEEAKQTARQEADNIRKEAEISSKQRIAEAMSDARKIVADANSESKRILDEAAARTRQLEVEYDSLLSSKMNFLTKFRNFLNTELDMVTASEELLEKAKPQPKPVIKQKIFTDKELDLAKTTVMPAITLPEEAENKADDEQEKPQAESEDK